MMERQVSHMARLVDDLLDVSRIARGKVRLRREPCDLKAIVHDVMEDHRPLIEAGGIRLVVENSAEPCGILGDGVRLAQIIGNILHNAQKFTNSGGEIRVTCETDRAAKFAVVRIRDTGIGMSRETLARVFDTFTQAENSLDRSKGGLGLGLSLAKGLANLHGGSIEASSDGLEKGSTFTLRFPLVESEAVAEPANNRVSVGSGQIRRILVIEDNRDMAHTMKMLLTHFGYQVETAATGGAGIELARQFRPNVVLCDIGLPGRDGYAVARALRGDSVTQSSYLIAQSGYGQDEDLRKAHEAGFDLHLTKPVDFTELNRILASIPT
jgi:CheY-like chemotaxis protein/anti-sigma regulatory factor (Ser/Thr protein kinase)